jgi:hypothetical protein
MWQNCGAHAAIPTWHDAEYPLDGSPAGVTSSDARLSAKMPSDRFDVGFDPLDAYTLLAYTMLLIASGNAICVTLTDRLLTFTSM